MKRLLMLLVLLMFLALPVAHAQVNPQIGHGAPSGVCLGPYVDTDTGNLYVCKVGQYSLSGGSVQVPVLRSTFTDLFSRASLGANWTPYLNTISPGSGAAVGTAAALHNTIAYTAGVTPSGGAQSSRSVIRTLNGGTDFPGPAVSIQGTAHTSVSFYLCQENNGTLNLVRVVGASDAANGVSTVLATAGIAGVAGDILILTRIGNDLSCSRNGQNPLLVANDTSPLAQTGFPGLSVFGNVATFNAVSLDSFSIPNTATANIVADGDSIIAANQLASFVDPGTNYLYISGAGAFPYVRNLGVSGKCLGIGCAAASAGTLQSMVATGTSVIDTMLVSGLPNLVIIDGCSNDIANGGRTPAQCITDTTTYVTNRHSVGWKVLVVQLLSRTSSLAIDQNIMVFNQSLNTVGADGIVLIPAGMTFPSSFSNTQLFVDGIHPTQLAQIDVFARALSAAIQQIPGF